MDERFLCLDGGTYDIKSDQTGYYYGERWDDGACGQVKHVAMFYGDIIHSIQTSYERDGVVAMSRIHGGNHGNFEMVDLNNEPLTWVSGYYGSWCLEYLPLLDEETDSLNYVNAIKSLKFGTDTKPLVHLVEGRASRFPTKLAQRLVDSMDAAHLLTCTLLGCIFAVQLHASLRSLRFL